MSSFQALQQPTPYVDVNAASPWVTMALVAIALKLGLSAACFASFSTS